MNQNDNSKKIAMRYLSLADIIGDAVCNRNTSMVDILKAVHVLMDEDTSVYAMSLAIQQHGSNPYMAAQIAGFVMAPTKPPKFIHPLTVQECEEELGSELLSDKNKGKL